MGHKPKPQPDAPAGNDRPARIRSEHAITNPLAPERHWKFEVRDDHPLTKCYDQGRLASGSSRYTAEDRFGAGTLYRGIEDAVNGSDVAVSNLNRVSGASTEARSSERICIARDLRKRIHARMQPDNAHIVSRVCGDGAFPSDAVNEGHKGFERHVTQRLCIALDDLTDAIIALGLHKKVSRETSE